ncbi:MAG: hypothetical protein JOZ22_02980 [Acidobacteriia bacterium]|nr:hypothetical protein [Terriglobia bacterium]
MQNEGLAELCAANPDRFAAFASVALQFPDLAAQQLEQGVKKAAAAWRGDRRPRQRCRQRLDKMPTRHPAAVILVKRGIDYGVR